MESSNEISPSLRLMLQNIGARGLIDLADQAQPASPQPGQPLVVTDSFKKTSGARGFLDLLCSGEPSSGGSSAMTSSSSSLAESLANSMNLSTLESSDPSVKKRGPVGFLSLTDHDVIANPQRSARASAPEVDFTFEEPTTTTTMLGRGADEAETGVDFADYTLSQLHTFWEDSRLHHFLDLTRMFDLPQLVLEKSAASMGDDAQGEAKQNHKLLEEPLGIYSRDTAGLTPDLRLGALLFANLPEVLSVVAMACLSSAKIDSMLQMFLAVHQQFIDSEDLLQYFLGDVHRFNQILRVWLGDPAFHRLWHQPAVSKQITIAKLSLLANDFSSVFYAAEQTTQFWEKLPTLWPLPWTQPSKQLGRRERLLVFKRVSSERASLLLSAHTYYKFLTTPVHSWYSAHLSPQVLNDLFELHAHLGNWCTLSLLSLSEVGERAEVLEWWIMTANHMLLLHNHFGAAAICSALSERPVARLAATFAIISEAASTLWRHKLQKWFQLFRPTAMMALVEQNIPLLADPAQLRANFSHATRQSSNQSSSSQSQKLVPLAYVNSVHTFLKGLIWTLHTQEARFAFMPSAQANFSEATLLYTAVFQELPKRQLTPDYQLKRSNKVEAKAVQPPPEMPNIRTGIENPKPLSKQSFPWPRPTCPSPQTRR